MKTLLQFKITVFYFNIQSWSELLAPLVKKNKPALLIILSFYFKKITNLTFHWTKTIENGGISHYEKKKKSNTHWTQLLVALEIIMSKIPPPEEYSHSYSQFWALQGDYEHELIQPWLPVSQKYKQEGKQSPNSVNHPGDDHHHHQGTWCWETFRLSGKYLV